jgi:hypothetical protein
VRPDISKKTHRRRQQQDEDERDGPQDAEEERRRTHAGALAPWEPDHGDEAHDDLDDDQQHGLGRPACLDGADDEAGDETACEQDGRVALLALAVEVVERSEGHERPRGVIELAGGHGEDTPCAVGRRQDTDDQKEDGREDDRGERAGARRRGAVEVVGREGGEWHVEEKEEPDEVACGRRAWRQQ